MHKGETIPSEPIADLEFDILQVAEHYHVLPDEVEQMDNYWFNRTLINLRAKNEANKKEE